MNYFVHLLVTFLLNILTTRTQKKTQTWSGVCELHLAQICLRFLLSIFRFPDIVCCYRWIVIVWRNYFEVFLSPISGFSPVDFDYSVFRGMDDVL